MVTKRWVGEKRRRILGIQNFSIKIQLRLFGMMTLRFKPLTFEFIPVCAEWDEIPAKT